MKQNATYTRNGETEYKVTYGNLEFADDDHTIYVSEINNDEPAESMTYGEFKAEFSEVEE